MMRGTSLRRQSSATIYDFLDPSFLHNKRPSIPGGAWPVDSLRKKSIGDLQQIWFQLVRERNMLLSTKEHYVKHQEELGAMPAPSRIQMVQESMKNIKSVMRERDEEANDKAVAIFQERLQRGVYRYPPGPQPPPGAGDETSTVVVELSEKISIERLRDIFGKFDVYEAHKGVVSIQLALTKEALAAKEEAEVAWETYRNAKQDAHEYNKWASTPSRHDYTRVEIAPGVFEPIQPTDAPSSTAAAVASDIPVPEPAGRIPAPVSTVERLKFEARPMEQRTTVQLGYFPNITSRPIPSEVPKRPVHPDEIKGPWVATIVYDKPDGFEYAKSLDVQTIDGSSIISITDSTAASKEPYAAHCPIYQEALREERAAEETLMQWPNVPQWKTDYSIWTKKDAASIVAYNYSNVLDYVEREVLLTGKSVWESPIDVDYTCGSSRNVPVHAQRPATLGS
mmetsp:Transcript_81142/g.94580  ORF Transcript_81142/g.94580 Transcript_81142/m.94580 type:complete len:452 (-) Transcript_81142:117-1472(-)